MARSKDLSQTASEEPLNFGAMARDGPNHFHSKISIKPSRCNSVGFSPLPPFRRSKSCNWPAISNVAPEIAYSAWFITWTIASLARRSFIFAFSCAFMSSSLWRSPHFHRCTFAVRSRLPRPVFFVPSSISAPASHCYFLRDFFVASSHLSSKAQLTFVSQLEATHSVASSSSNPANGSKTSRFCTNSCWVGKRATI